MDALLQEIERSVNRTPVARWVLLGVAGVGVASALIAVGAMAVEAKDTPPESDTAAEPESKAELPAATIDPPPADVPPAADALPDVGTVDDKAPKPPFALREMEIDAPFLRTVKGVIEVHETLEKSGPFTARTVCNGPMGPTVYYDGVSPSGEPDPTIRSAGSLEQFEIMAFISDTDTYPLEPPCEIGIGVKDQIKGYLPPVYACWDGSKVELGRCAESPNGVDPTLPEDMPDAAIVVDHVAKQMGCFNDDCLELVIRVRSFTAPAEYWSYQSTMRCRQRRRTWEDDTFTFAQTDSFDFTPGERRELLHRHFVVDAEKLDYAKATCDIEIGSGELGEEPVIVWWGCLERGELVEGSCDAKPKPPTAEDSRREEKPQPGSDLKNPFAQ